MVCQCYINGLCYANLVSTPIKKNSYNNVKDHEKVICESKWFSRCPRLKELVNKELLIVTLDYKRGRKKVSQVRPGFELFSTEKPHRR
jgi:hypothetical protein